MIPMGMSIHDIFELPNGNLLITGGDNQSQTVEDVLIEINRNTGHIIRFINMKKYLDENHPGRSRIQYKMIGYT